MTPAEAAARADLGTATAVKRGRNKTRPHVPIIQHSTGGIGGGPRTEQIKGLAYATHQEAVDAASVVIASRRLALAERLTNPRLRALRAKHGVT